MRQSPTGLRTEETRSSPTRLLIITETCDTSTFSKIQGTNFILEFFFLESNLVSYYPKHIKVIVGDPFSPSPTTVICAVGVIAHPI